jgi:fatty-acyl-CoA synthase
VTITRGGCRPLWIIVTDWLDRTGSKVFRARPTLSSGAAPPRALVEKLEREYGVKLAQVWGMTEALGGSLVTMRPGSANLPSAQRIGRRMKSERASFAVK